MIIRKAKVEDSLQIAIVNVYTWKTQYTGLMSDALINERINSVEQVARKIADRMNKDNTSIVLEVENTVVGFCRYGASRNEKYRDSGEIYALYLLDGFQGKGYGKNLFYKAKEDLKSQGYNTMIINCLKGNPSLEFYKHMGGKVVAEDKMIVNDIELVEDVLYYEI